MGYSVSKVCRILNFPRSRYYRRRSVNNGSFRKRTVEKTNREESIIREKIISICLRYPRWGSRRIRNWLRRREGMKINRKRVQRIMSPVRLAPPDGEEKLILRPSRKKASRDSGRRKPIATRVHQWWGIDMTKFQVETIGWVYLVAVINWYSRKVVGYALDIHCRSDLWISTGSYGKALEEAVLNEFPDGSRGNTLFLMSDNGSQPTSKKFMNVTGTLGIQQIFTSYNNPKGNANTERWFRTLKEYCIWVNEWYNLKETKKTIAQWIAFYNNQYVHSPLNGLSPNEFIQQNSLKKWRNFVLFFGVHYR